MKNSFFCRSGAIIAFVLMAAVGTADEARALPSIRVPKVEAPARIDGSGRDPVWSQATAVELRDFLGETQSAPAQRTRVSLLHDSERLYVAFDCEDRNVRAFRTAKEDQTFRDDCIEILLGAPIERLADAACLEINALGTLADYYYRHADWINYRFDSKAEIAVSHAPVHYEVGYRIEVAIPFAVLQPVLALFPMEGPVGTLSGPPGKLRANFARWDRNGGEGDDRFTIWSDPLFPFPHPHRPERYGWLILEP